MAQEITLDELWALAKEHARSLDRKPGYYLPTVDRDKKMWVRGDDGRKKTEVFFHIDNDPAIYITTGSLDDLVYVECESLRKWERFEGINESEVMENKQELRDRLQVLVQ